MNIYPVLCYVSGPYSDERGAYYVKQNIEAAEQVAVALWRAGIPNICPHKNTEFLDGIIPYESWLDGDFQMVERCDFILLAPGWRKSRGARAEREHAIRNNVAVFDIRVPGDWQKMMDFAEGIRNAKAECEAFLAVEGVG